MKLQKGFTDCYDGLSPQLEDQYKGFTRPSTHPITLPKIKSVLCTPLRICWRIAKHQPKPRGLSKNTYSANALAVKKFTESLS